MEHTAAPFLEPGGAIGRSVRGWFSTPLADPRSNMTLNPESKYPSRRAFVLKLRSDAHPGALSGRLENLVTGKQHEFSSDKELLDSIASDLRASRDETAPSDR